MKNILLLSFLLLLSTVLLAQDATPIDRLNYRITYELTFQPGADTNLTKNEKMLLLIGDSTSLFGSKNAYLRDSMMTKMKADKMPVDQMMLTMKDLPRSAFNYSVLKRKNSLKTIFQQQVGMDQLSYEEPLTVSEWRITGESGEKVGYQCQKATTSYGGRDYEAWFTFEVPLQDGPYKFGNLPGLIVELYDTQDHYHFTLVGLEKVADGTITLNQKKLLTVNRKKFTELQASYEADPLGAITRATGGMSSTKITMRDKNGKELSEKEMNDMMKTKQKGRNNPIELE